MEPVTAVIAVTLNCNARCVMCDIWKNDMHGELEPREYSVLPSSLRDINISGGEPFLRKDLPELIGVIKQACPKARLVISSNGFTPARIEESLKEILKIDPKIGLRISIDGYGDKHFDIRGIREGFEKDMKTLRIAQRLGVKDLGIGMTIMGQNLDHIRPLYKMACEMGLEFSVTAATDSEIYFGNNQSRHRPEDRDKLAEELTWLSENEYRSLKPKRWFRGWYEKRFLKYLLDGNRPLSCDAGSGFFYLDSMGQVYACHLLPLKMGNIRKQSWQEIWNSDEAAGSRVKAASCDACWMVCTSKSQMRQNLPRIATQVVKEKLISHLGWFRDQGPAVPKNGNSAPQPPGPSLPILNESPGSLPLEENAGVGS